MSPNRKVFFLHIPKCAGQSIAHALESAVDDKGRVLAIWDPELGAEMGPVEFQAANPEVLSNYQLIWGHLPFPIFRDKFGAGPTKDDWYVFTNIREPLDRAVSEYLYIRRTSIHPQHDYCSNHSLAEFLREEFRDNGQCLYICGKADFTAARSELETYFDTYGAFEDLSALWSRVSGDLGIEDRPTLPVLNQRETEGRPSLSNEDLSAFYHRNIHDLQLYWSIKKR